MSKKKSKVSSETATTVEKELVRPHSRIIENFLIVWLDQNLDNELSDDCLNIINRLRKIVNTINTFTEVDNCVDFLSDIKDETVFMILSGALGQQIISYIHDLPQLHSIFIFCGIKTKHEQWTKDWPKIKGVFTQTRPMCDALKQTVRKCEQDFIPVSFMTANQVSDQHLDQSFMYTQILKEIIFEIKYNEQSSKDLVKFCREKYVGNMQESDNIDNFEKNYRQHSPIWWYTYQCFLHLMLNRALRTHEVDTIIKLGFFIQDLHRQISELHREQENDQQKRLFTVYRGQGMTKIDFEKLIQAKGGIMSFNNFLSTSKKRKVSLEYAEDALNNFDMIGILFKITIEPTNISTPFALIDGISCYSSEQEILFSMHTVFRIGEIKQIDNRNRLYQVELKLTSIKNQQILSLIERMRIETQGSTGWHRLGMLLIKLGKFDKAEQVYRTLFDLTTEKTERALLDHQLGLIKRNQGDYQEALACYEKALEVYRTKLPDDHPDLATSYNNIGQVYYSMGEYLKALEFYEKSLDIYKKIFDDDDDNHQSLAISYNNIGLIQRCLGDYSKALKFHEKALLIEQKILPENHPSLATSYNNIGLVYKNMGEYSKALESHEKALDIEQKTLPANHPALAISYSNIGLLYDNIGEYTKALSFYEKTLEIYQKILPLNHPDLARAYNNIGSIYKNMGEYAKALLFYEKTLEIEEKVLPTNHPDRAISYSNIGIIYENIQEYTKALESHKKALDIQTKTLPNERRLLATFYNNLGSVYDAMGDYTEALVYYEKTLEIEQKTLSLNHPDLATSYNNIGLIYINQKEYNTALDYHTKALQIYKQSLPSNHPNLANSYNNLALVYEKLTEYAKALVFYEKALDIRLNCLPSSHPDLAISFSNLWQCYQIMGDHVRAYSTYRQSLETRDKQNINVYKAIEQVNRKKTDSTLTNKLMIKNIQISQLPQRFPVKNFRMKLELKMNNNN